VEGACRLYSEAHGWIFQPSGPELGNSLVAEMPDAEIALERMEIPGHGTIAIY
jgi:hypothetical protein